MSKTFFVLEALKVTKIAEKIACISRIGNEYYKTVEKMVEKRSGQSVTVHPGEMVFLSIELASGEKRSFTGMLINFDNNSIKIGIVDTKGKMTVETHSYFVLRRLNILRNTSVSIWLGSLPYKNKTYKAIGSNVVRGVYLEEKKRESLAHSNIQPDHKLIASNRRGHIDQMKRLSVSDKETLEEMNKKAVAAITPEYQERLSKVEIERRAIQAIFDRSNHNGHCIAYKNHVETSWADFKARRKSARKASKAA